MNRKLNILFLCTGNSCRSQIAEGLTRQFKSETIEAYSAGMETHGLNPLAVKVMAEIGIDISPQKSKKVKDLSDVKFDHVITVCDNAQETCPVFPKPVNRYHVSFQDPPELARDAKNEADALKHYRKVRDEIKAFVMTLPESLESGQQEKQIGKETSFS